ncbi:hypothetical protein AB1Y20_013796 [Prymnesium parvum]|uniref:Aquaporin n=1 Tax=Prymnesium parvum TaxID=97485 RepID=A0AB34IG33_PRYPA|mmetsp:Transcript_43633/g.108601  ORF Transcript_43633/g.108601 Transcript_43633/m.108601 type:complete len:265 (-) Transcript_43633:364-1158(-)
MKRALAAEFMGTLLFQLVGGTENSPVHNGVVLAVVIYMTAAISGGVVNPAVATGLLIAGEMPRTKWALYVIAQLSGAVVGALIAGLIYDECYVTPDHPQHMGCFKDYSYFNTGPGCVPDTPPEAYFRVWAWEFIGTFMLVGVVFETVVSKPGFGNVAPLAIGAAVFVNVGSSGGVTGGAYNPARFFGPAMAFGCRIGLVWLYWSAQLGGGILAALAHSNVLLPKQKVASTSSHDLPEEHARHALVDDVPSSTQATELSAPPRAA